MVALLLMVLSASPLDAAKAHLAAGKLDDVLFDLDGKTFSDAEKPMAVQVLASAARSGLDAKDLVLSLQFAQMALRLDKNDPLALESGARASLAQKQFDPAEEYADRWMAVSGKAGAARLLRAEIALEEGEWAKVVELSRELDARTLSEADRKKLLLVVRSAMKELGERDAARAEAKTLQVQFEAQMKNAVSSARSLPVSARADLKKAIIYGTDWCGFCRKAKGWFQTRGIPFEEKNVETDSGAAEELAEKKKAIGRQGEGGVPWIDTGSELVHGFDVPALERIYPK